MNLLQLAVFFLSVLLRISNHRQTFIFVADSSKDSSDKGKEAASSFHGEENDNNEVKLDNNNTEKGFMGSNGGSGKQSGSGGGDFAQNALKAHNKFRKVHGAPEMKLDEQMSKSAEEYAKKIAQMGTLKHSSSDERSGNGENLAMKCSSREEDEMSAEEATKNWSVFCTWPCVAALFLDLVMF